MSTMRITTIAAALALVAGTASAQDTGRFSLELNGGVALPTSDLGPSELKTGANAGLTANLLVLPHLAIYGGWDYANFQMESALGDYRDVEATGYLFGARFFVPSMGVVTPWLGGGGVVDHVELEGDDNDASVSDDHRFGWEAGAGAAVALGARWSLQPGVRYRTFPSELTELGGDADLSYVTIGIGVSYTFGGRSMAAVRHQ